MCHIEIVSVHCVRYLYDVGEWAFDDYGVSCMYANDYRSVGGYNTTHEKWQLELYERYIASSLQVRHPRWHSLLN